MNFHFWQPSPNEHESGWIRGLASRGHCVRVYFSADMPEWRMSLGLGQVNYGSAELIKLTKDQLALHLIQYASSSDFHYFTGIKEFPLNLSAYKILSRSPARLFYISESKDPRGIRGVARFLRDVVFDFGRTRRIDAVLPMGQLGTKWFKNIGFSSDRIFEYCYAVADVLNPSPTQMPKLCPLKIVYVGQLIQRKRVDSLLAALAILDSEELQFSLEIIGSGADENMLKRMVVKLGLSHAVSFLGPMKNEVLRSHLLSSDLLMLPSAWDGWGAVTNEALLAGCRVGVSLMSGSSVLCKGLEKCFTFTSGNVAEIAKHLRYQVAFGNVTGDERLLRMRLVNKIIGQDAITEYLLKIVSYVIGSSGDRPNSPWAGKKPVALIYHFFPRYRGPILEKLQSSAACDFVLAADTDGRAIDPSIEAWKPIGGSSFVKLPVVKLPRHLYWQPHLIWFACRTPVQCAVLLGDPNNLSTWVSALIFRLRNIRVIFWAHGWIDENEHTLKRLYRNLFFLLPHGLLLYGRRAKRIAIYEGFNARRIWVIYNSLDYSTQRAVRETIPTSDCRNLRHALFGNVDMPVVACISRLTSIRRLDLLIEAAALLKVDGRALSLLFIGDGPERVNLEARAKAVGVQLHCTGAIYDELKIGPLLCCAAVTVAPGKVGLTAMHSLAYGVPVLTHGDFNHQMPECESIVPGLTGDFFSAGNVVDIAATIRRWTETADVPNVVRQNCFSVIERFYNADTQANIIESAIFDVEPPLTIGDAIQSHEVCLNNA